MFEWGKQRFLEEARTLAQFRHASIVRVLHVFEALNTAYMVLEFESGESLLDWLENLERAPTQDELDRLLPPLLDALQVLHERNLIHRDIAPDNVIVRPDNTPVLLDFGSARQAFAAESKTLTSIVKAGYSPPEQYQSGQDAQGPWTDIYALGATIYRAITGAAPDAAPARQLGDIYVPSGQAAKTGYRPSFLAAIDQALLLQPDLRPQTMTQFRSALLANEDTAATTLPGSAPPEPRHYQTDEYETHVVHKSALTAKPKGGILRGALVAVLLLATTIGGYLFYANWTEEQDRLAREAREAERVRLTLLKEKRERERLADEAAAAAARKLAEAKRRAREKREAEAARRAALVRTGRNFPRLWRLSTNGRGTGRAIFDGLTWR